MNARPDRRTALASITLSLGLSLVVLPTLAAAGGFDEPVLVLPETGLWADGFTDLAYGRGPGLAILWGLDSATVVRPPGAPEFDWSKVPYQTIVQVFAPDGKRIMDEQKVVDPPHREDGMVVGGFPLIVRSVIRTEGVYRVRLEAYPLMDPAVVGLDSVPRHTVETSATVARVRPEQTEWEISDILILRDMQPWRAGVSPHRTWYDWSFDPSPSRVVEVDSSGAFLAFELQRAREVVPRCQLTNCRVAITVYDDEGGLALQTLRPVPDPDEVSAYVVPIETMALAPGEYQASVDVYEAGEVLTSERRRFRVRESRAANATPTASEPKNSP